MRLVAALQMSLKYQFCVNMNVQCAVVLFCCFDKDSKFYSLA
jgi:hypothetical protein